MCYVDLNPVRAGIAQRLEDCAHTSLAMRLQGGANPAEPLLPLASGLADDGQPEARLGISFGDYANRAGTLLAEHVEGLGGDGIVKPGGRQASSQPNPARATH